MLSKTVRKLGYETLNATQLLFQLLDTITEFNRIYSTGTQSSVDIAAVFNKSAFVDALLDCIERYQDDTEVLLPLLGTIEILLSGGKSKKMQPLNAIFQILKNCSKEWHSFIR
jgi:hypothetical protein